ncbi:MAG: hypothetical protein NTX76_03325 [Alphaproteobacteria bacterium]|nr:hypothetical protein [Alphaproteobacteria bacterium]
MIRSSTIFVTGLCLFIALILFRVKYEVMALELQHRQINRTIQETKETLHILKAEWALLNEPARLQRLAVKYLPGMKPLKSAQLISFDDLLGGEAGYDKAALEDLIAEATINNDAQAKHDKD